MPSWMKHTLHLVAIAAAIVVTLPVGVGIPHVVVAAAGIIGLIAAKVTPGMADQVKS